VLEIPLMFAGPAFAAEATGNGALSLAAIVGQHSPALTAAEKHLLVAYLDGRPKPKYPPRKKIVVRANEATCRISDVDITAKSCDLKFGARAVSLAGRRAQELYATLIEVGVPSSGAAGLIIESVKALACTIDPVAGAPGEAAARTALSRSIHEALAGGSPVGMRGPVVRRAEGAA